MSNQATATHKVRVRHTVSLQGAGVTIATCTQSQCDWMAVDTSGLPRNLDPYIDHHEATAETSPRVTEGL